MKMGIDLLEQLQNLKAANETLQEANGILFKEAHLNQVWKAKLGQANGLGEIDASLVSEKHCYHISQIKELALRYRLRFLPVSNFKNELPTEAIRKIEHLKKSTGNENLENALYILAPEEMFRLSDINSDPMLFAATNTGKYYFIHKWGGELNPGRAILGRMLRNEKWAIASIFVLGCALGLMIPDFFFQNAAPQVGSFSLIAFKSFYGVFTLSAVFSYWFFLRCSGLNNRIWNSKHFNF